MAALIVVDGVVGANVPRLLDTKTAISAGRSRLLVYWTLTTWFLSTLFLQVLLVSSNGTKASFPDNNTSLISAHRLFAERRHLLAGFFNSGASHLEYMNTG